MPKTLLCKITLLISWIFLLYCQQVKGSSFYRNQVPDADFPYAYWKPTSSQSLLPTPERFVGEHPKEDYNYYYGNPISSEKHNDASTWNVPPIKVPKDVVGEVNERTTVRASLANSLASYPSSFSPQYGRYPGVTEAPPLYFPQRLVNKNSIDANNNDLQSSYSHYTPMESEPRRQFWTQNVHHVNPQSPAEPFFPSEAKNNYHNYQTLYRPPKLINILAIDRNQEPPPHAFYAIEHPSQGEMKILQKNGTHMSYVTPQEQRRRFITEQKENAWSQKKRIYQTNKQKYNWNYNRFNQKNSNYPYNTRRKYNENLIDRFKDKIENKVRKTTIKSATPLSINQHVYHKQNDIKRKALLANTHNVNLGHNFINEPTTNFYNTVNTTKFAHYETTPTPYISQSTNINPKYTKAHPHIVYPTRPYPPLNYNVDQSDNVHNFFNGATISRTPKPAPNAYPEVMHSSGSITPNQYLYFYDKDKEEKETFDFDTQSLLERMAGIQQLPVSLVIPGGLAALGFGLAYYYFNYVWYPTPVVTARLSEFLRSFGDHENMDRSQSDNTIRKIVEVFRGIEAAQFNSEFGKDSCRNRIVCQLHQDIPNLWEATNIISPLLRTKPDNTEFDKVIDAYMNTAKMGSQSRNSCKRLFRACKLPYLSLKPLIDFFFNSKEKKPINHGDSKAM